MFDHNPRCRYLLGMLGFLCLFSNRSDAVVAQALQPNTNSMPSVSVLSAPIVTAGPKSFQPAAPQQDNTPLSAEAVRSSIVRGIDFLKHEQQADGSWPKFGTTGDTTALCTLALLNCDENPNTPYLRNAIQHILTVPEGHQTTYFVSLRIMALAAADPKGEKYRREIAKDVEWLVRMQVGKTGGRNAGGWSYGHAPGTGADASNSQFALLALHEAGLIGVKRTPQENWELALQYWLKCFDQRTGGFYYTAGGGDVRGSMTCAGISSLIIIGENLADLEEEVNGDRAVCCGEQGGINAVEQAIDWMGKNFAVKLNPTGFGRGNANQLYFLYGMERAGRLAGRRFFGPHDWYRAGANELIKKQNRVTGSWRTAGHGERDERIATSFALLFLAKGKRPVAIGKYDYGEGNNWDQHPKGVHYLTRRLEDQWKQKLNWQTVKADNASVDDLLETPVLFLSGKDAINLNADQKADLKKYVENGGFIFAEACRGEGCDDGGFDRAFRELMAEIFPESQLAPLDLGHPIWSAHYPVLPNPERPLLGLQACCRTSVVYCPANLSAYWALNRPAIESLANDGLKERIEYCTQLGTNVVTYATGRQLKEKGETPTVVEDSTEALSERVLVFPKLIHGGGADDAPNAWRNILTEVRRAGLRIKMDKKLILPELDALGDYPFVFMHGRNAFQFTDQRRSALRTYLDVGGFIFADSICSSPQFTNSFRNEIKTILGEALTPIPADHEIWTDPRFGHRIDQVTLRTRDNRAKGGFLESVRKPELEGISSNGRLIVVFSPNDLSCAMENTQVSQCNGYTRDDAAKIGSNVILYSLLSDIGKQD